MSDIVERLRADTRSAAHCALSEEAADEIERLARLEAVCICKELSAEIERLRAANDCVGKWLSAALEDPAVCEEMKADVRAWFDAQKP